MTDKKLISGHMYFENGAPACVILVCKNSDGITWLHWNSCWGPETGWMESREEWLASHCNLNNDLGSYTQVVKTIQRSKSTKGGQS
jgi:hypothetical protein